MYLRSRDWCVPDCDWCTNVSLRVCGRKMCLYICMYPSRSVCVTHVYVHTLCCAPPTCTVRTRCRAPPTCTVRTRCRAPPTCTVRTRCRAPPTCTVRTRCRAPPTCTVRTRCRAPPTCTVRTRCRTPPTCTAVLWPLRDITINHHCNYLGIKALPLPLPLRISTKVINYHCNYISTIAITITKYRFILGCLPKLLHLIEMSYVVI